MSSKNVALGEVCIVKRGTTITQKEATEGEIPVVAGGLKPTYYHNQANRLGNTITISGSGANAGFVNFWNQPIFASDCSTVEVVNNKLDITYVYYFLLSKQQYIYNELRSGAAQPHVYGKDIAKIIISVPSIQTQQKIVAKLDAIFAEIDTATAAAEANANNAEALFQSYLDKLFEHDAVLYNKINIKDVCKIGDGNHSSKYPKKDEMVESGIAFIRSTNIVNGTISDKELVYLTEAKHKELKKGHLKTGDVLITNRGEIGKVAIVDKRFNNSNLNSQIAWLRCNPTLNNQYLLYFLMSAKMKNFYSDTKTGAALQQLPIGKIEEIKIPLPNLEVQNSRCFEFMSVQQKCLVSISSYKTKLVQLFELKQSILQRAFSGELVKD